MSNVLLFLPWGGLVAVWLARGHGSGTALVAGTASGVALSRAWSNASSSSPLRGPPPGSTWRRTRRALHWARPGVVRGPRHLARGRGRSEVPGGERPLAVLAAVAALGVLLASLAPFDVSLDVGDLKASVRAARLLPFGRSAHRPRPPKPWAWAGEVLMWAMLGGLCTLALRETRFGGFAASSSPWGRLVGFATFIELAQLTIREPDVGCDVGRPRRGRGCRRRLRRAPDPRRTPRDWVIPALLLWALAIVLEAWTPPRFIPRAAGTCRGRCSSRSSRITGGPTSTPWPTSWCRR